MAQYRKKPVVVEALRWEGSMDSQREIVNWSSGVVVGMFGGAFDEPQRYFLEIYTLEGTMRAEIGDWVIRGVQGEYYPCRDDIFRMTYEEIGSGARSRPDAIAVDGSVVADARGRGSGWRRLAV